MDKKKKKDLIIQISIRVVIALLIWAIIAFLFNELKQPIANSIYRNNTLMYSSLVQYSGLFYAFIIALLPIIMVILMYKLVVQIINPVYKITDSIDKVFKKDDELVKLPQEYKDVEDKLNKMKYSIIRNEQVAKEAEQRKNDLVVYLAHDLKTPLTSVIGYLTLLDESDDLPKEFVKKYVNISLNKAERLEELINEFFEITRFNLQNINISKEKINIIQMINQLKEEFYPMFASKNIKCNVNTSISNNYIYGDSDKLARVFDNILRNAINYSYENTDININIDGDEKNINISFRNKGDMIPEDKLDKIFEKFYRLDVARRSTTGGSGLGLAIAKEIVELHGGKISATSNDEYTEFLIVLPVSQS